MYAACKTRLCQRSRQQVAVVNPQPDIVSVADVEIGMRREKGQRLGGGRVAKAIDIMVAVALGVGNADQCAKRKILLHAKAGLAGQILARYEELFAARAPFGSAGCVEIGRASC